MENNICLNWFEDNGEWCKGKCKSCTCSGVKEQCNYTEHFKLKLPIYELEEMDRIGKSNGCGNMGRL